jgi:hypothetical protein
MRVHHSNEHHPVAAVKMRRPAGIVLTVGVLSWVSSCASLGPDTGAAAGVAVTFHQALSTSDGAAACALLAPETAAKVATLAGTECADAVLDEDVPDATAVESSQAFGRSAQVQMDDDVLFLAIFDGQWRITAAGCQYRGEQPYDCQLKGG